ncbi:adenylyltransferase/cytidyltransferase family protein [Methylobacterium sp. R2-1]|uniref:adenylyltransferase/cytidyltransferase family protein n=1 Tax=Methylobacterium sp. R2-1 TaxID=2587064 RepID=UPI001613CCF1
MITGCIHGRFQPFHNGHFEYMKEAFRRSDNLIIGLTQYEPEIFDPESPEHRMRAQDNPFSYWERSQIIMAAVADADIPLAKISIVPFPIHAPEKIKYFVGADCIMFTTIYERWNIDKIRRLKRCGFEVSVLWRRRRKQYEGKLVRNAIREHDASIRGLVPRGVYSKIAEVRPDLF